MKVVSFHQMLVSNPLRQIQQSLSHNPSFNKILVFIFYYETQKCLFYEINVLLLHVKKYYPYENPLSLLPVPPSPSEFLDPPCSLALMTPYLRHHDPINITIFLSLKISYTVLLVKCLHLHI